MKRFLTLLFFLPVLTFSVSAQLSTDKAYISFYSEMDNITAENSSVNSTLNVTTGELSFTVEISGFEFANKTMQKHFNQEGVMNSVEFPKAVFTGKITNNGDIDYTADGTYTANVSGTMTIKGVSKDFSVKGLVTISGGKVSVSSAFELDRFEYGVDAKEESVSKILAIKVKATY